MTNALSDAHYGAAEAAPLKSHKEGGPFKAIKKAHLALNLNWENRSVRGGRR
jgi:hypothetical protein